MHFDGRFDFTNEKTQSYYFNRIDKNNFYVYYFSYDDLKLYDTKFIKSLFDKENNKQSIETPIYIVYDETSPYYTVNISDSVFFDKRFCKLYDDNNPPLSLFKFNDTNLEPIDYNDIIDERIQEFIDKRKNNFKFNLINIIKEYAFESLNLNYGTASEATRNPEYNLKIRKTISDKIRSIVLSQFKKIIDLCIDEIKKEKSEFVSETNYITNISSFIKSLTINNNSFKIEVNENNMIKDIIKQFKEKINELIDNKEFSPDIKSSVKEPIDNKEFSPDIESSNVESVVGEVTVKEQSNESSSKSLNQDKPEDFTSENYKFIRSRIALIDPKDNGTLLKIKNIFLDINRITSNKFIEKFKDTNLNKMFPFAIKNKEYISIPVGYVEIKNPDTTPYLFFVFLTSDNKFTLYLNNLIYKITIGYQNKRGWDIYDIKRLSKNLNIEKGTVDEINNKINKQESINEEDLKTDLKFYTYQQSKPSMFSFFRKTGGRRTRHKGKSFANKKSKRRYKV